MLNFECQRYKYIFNIPINKIKLKGKIIGFEAEIVIKDAENGVCPEKWLK